MDLERETDIEQLRRIAVMQQLGRLPRMTHLCSGKLTRLRDLVIRDVPILA